MYPEIRTGQLWMYVPERTPFLITRVDQHYFECLWRAVDGRIHYNVYDHDRQDPPRSAQLQGTQYELLEDA